MKPTTILSLEDVKRLGLVLSLDQSWYLIQHYWYLITGIRHSNSEALIASLRQEDELSAEALSYLYERWLNETLDHQSIRAAFEEHYVQLVRSQKFKTKKGSF